MKPRIIDDINVLPVGSRVTIGNEVSAIITTISIAADRHVRYECAWWHGNERKSGWLSQHEVAAATEARLSIGFRTPASDS